MYYTPKQTLESFNVVIGDPALGFGDMIAPALMLLFCCGFMPALGLALVVAEVRRKRRK